MHAESVQGRVTDFDTQLPLSGVQVSSGSAITTQTDTNGIYRLDFAAAGIHLRSTRHSSASPTAGPNRFSSHASESPASAESRNLKGARIPNSTRGSLPNHFWAFATQPLPALAWPSATGPFAIPSFASLAKSAAVHPLTFALSGYMPAVQQITGSHDSLHITLKKGSLPARLSQLTWYTSYPDPNSEECVVYNGCTWAGQFAALNGKQPESWVQAHNIAAVHEKDFPQYKLKTLRITQGSRQIDAVVYDMCSDSDCDGCCTQNAQPSGFLIDLESYTKTRFGSGAGQVSWICLDCD
jgi:hypothetical protein